VTATTHRALVVLNLPTRVTDFVKFGQGIVAAMTGNAHFPSPTPTLAAVTALLTTLVTTETAAATRAKGTVPARNAAKAAAVAALQQLKAYVQQVADADPENAESIITSATMSVRKATSHTKAPFTVKQGSTSGTARLVAKAVAERASYVWQWSSDGGKTWTAVTPTLQAKTTITGLPVGTSCAFRFQALTKGGEEDWSQVVTMVVK
jgi:hypothetical protein